MIRILIVDDQNFTRKAIQAILEEEEGIEVIGQAANGIEALKFIKYNIPDIALVDLEMPEMNGYNLTYQITRNFQKTKVIILSVSDDRESIDTAVKAGAKGYLLKTTSGKEIADTIRYVQRGYFQLGPGLFEKILSNFNEGQPVTSNDLLRLQNHAQQSFEQLEAQLLDKNELVRRELFQELEIQINTLKQDFRKGLEIFQQKVGDRLNRGLNSHGDRQTRNPDLDFQNWEKQIEARDARQQQQINKVISGAKQAIAKLEKKVNLLAYCIIFLAVIFFAEKIVLFVF